MECEDYECYHNRLWKQSCIYLQQDLPKTDLRFQCAMKEPFCLNETYIRVRLKFIFNSVSTPLFEIANLWESLHLQLDCYDWSYIKVWIIEMVLLSFSIFLLSDWRLIFILKIFVAPASKQTLNPVGPVWLRNCDIAKIFLYISYMLSWSHVVNYAGSSQKTV